MPTKNTFTIVVQSRSRELAERRARDLRRKYDAEKVEIIARRSASGRYSERGQFFTIRITPKSATEYVLHFDYGSNKKGKKQLIRFQLHLVGPNDATDAEAIAVGIAIDLGVQSVEKWEFKTITWGHPPKPATNPWSEELRDLYDTATEVGAKSVARKTKI